MDSAELLLNASTAAPLVFILGPGPIGAQLLKAYEDYPGSKKVAYFPPLSLCCRIKFACLPLETQFSQAVRASSLPREAKRKGPLNLCWLRRYRELVTTYCNSKVPVVLVAIFDYSEEQTQTWATCEQTILDKYKDLQYLCSMNRE